MELLDNDPIQKTAKKYICKCCNFICSKLSNYNTHLATAKHKRIILADEIKQKKPYHFTSVIVEVVINICQGL